MTEEIVTRMEECAILLYQNREQEAYDILKEIIGVMNQLLQYIVQKEPEKATAYVQVFKPFVAAYQRNDNLAMADMLCVDIPNVLSQL